jgi:hypothetical protein
MMIFSVPDLTFSALMPLSAVREINRMSWLNKTRIKKRYSKSLRMFEKKEDLKDKNGEYFRNQYLFNLEPLLRKSDWGEIYPYEKILPSPDKGTDQKSIKHMIYILCIYSLCYNMIQMRITAKI